MKKFLFGALAVALLMAGCGGGGKSSVIKAGWLGSLTGDQAVWGECELNTVKMLFEEYNAAGGIEVVALQLRLERGRIIGQRLPGNPAQRPAGQQRPDEGTHDSNPLQSPL